MASYQSLLLLVVIYLQYVSTLFTAREMLANRTILLTPSVLFCSVEQGVVSFANVRFIASWTVKLVYHTGVAQ